MCEAKPSTVQLSVLELDVTSIGGIEGIRDRVDESRHFNPYSTWRVYILDEAHHLATGLQQDALLKPLEEPGSKSIWILVTTAPEKLNKPVRQRTTPVLFAPLAEEDVVGLLKQVSEAEGANVGPSDIARLAGIADGSPRAALILLDQLLIGIPPSVGADTSSLVSRLVTTALEGDVASTLDLAASIAEGRNASSVGDMFGGIADDILEIRREGEPSMVRLRGRQHVAALKGLDPTSLNEFRETARLVSSSEVDARVAAGLCTGLLFAALREEPTGAAG